MDMEKHYTVPAGRELMLDSALERWAMMILFTLMKGARLYRKNVEHIYRCDIRCAGHVAKEETHRHVMQQPTERTATWVSGAEKRIDLTGH